MSTKRKAKKEEEEEEVALGVLHIDEEDGAEQKRSKREEGQEEGQDQDQDQDQDQKQPYVDFPKFFTTALAETEQTIKLLQTESKEVEDKLSDATKAFNCAKEESEVQSKQHDALNAIAAHKGDVSVPHGVHFAVLKKKYTPSMDEVSDMQVLCMQGDLLSALLALPSFVKFPVDIGMEETRHETGMQLFLSVRTRPSYHGYSDNEIFLAYTGMGDGSVDPHSLQKGVNLLLKPSKKRFDQASNKLATAYDVKRELVAKSRQLNVKLPNVRLLRLVYKELLKKQKAPMHLIDTVRMRGSFIELAVGTRHDDNENCKMVHTSTSLKDGIDRLSTRSSYGSVEYASETLKGKGPDINGLRLVPIVQRHCNVLCAVLANTR